MTSFTQTQKLDIMELSKGVTITIKFKRMHEWTWRVKLGAFMLRFACWILPFGVEVVTDADD